jgi:hypothetical protein
LRASSDDVVIGIFSSLDVFGFPAPARAAAAAPQRAMAQSAAVMVDRPIIAVLLRAPSYGRGG